MSGSAQVNGVRATHMTITIPEYGAWTADVTLEGVAPVSGAVTLTLGNLTLKGTTFRSSAFAGSRLLRIVGGAAGWRKAIPPRGYSLSGRVTLSTVVSDAAKEVGETVSIGTDRNLGSFYIRDRGKAKRVLSLLTGNVWYIDSAGVTQVRSRPTSPIASPFTVVKWDGGRGMFEIATETYEDWLPGRTFTTNTVPDMQTISSVTIDADNDGKVRLTVLTSRSGRERLLSDFRAIVQDELAAFSYAGVYEYVIAAGASALGLGYTIDASPTDARMPPITKAPLAPELGKVSPAVAGTKCRVRFVNCDPTRPEVISIASTTEHYMTVEACALLIYNTFASLALANPGIMLGLPTAIAAPAAITAALAAQSTPAPPGAIAQALLAPTLASQFASGLPTYTSAPFNAGAAALSTKMPNVSGLFPGVGVPNGG